jgi:hypothetical protein
MPWDDQQHLAAYLAEDDLIGVVVLEGERVRALGTFVLNLAFLRHQSPTGGRFNASAGVFLPYHQRKGTLTFDEHLGLSACV